MILKVAALTILFLSIIKAAPNDEICSTPVCNCTAGSLVCFCRNREDITLTNLKLQKRQNETSDVVVESCGNVTLDTNTLDRQSLNSIIFKDIDYLHIKKNSFANIPYVNTLEFNDIKELDIEPRGFAGIQDMTHLTLRRVIINKLPSDSFALRKTDGILITNCTFGTLEEHSFSLINATNFIISNSRLGNLHKNAFVIHSVDNALIEFSLIQSIEYRGISVLRALNVTFTECNFINLHPNAFQIVSKRKWFFVKNHIEYAGANAFDDVRATSCTFANNTFRKTEVAFLGFSYTSPTYSCTFGENEFVCTNSLLWLCNFQSDYKNLLQKARCKHDATSVSLFLTDEYCRYQDARNVRISLMKNNFSKGMRNYLFASLQTLLTTAIIFKFLH